MQVKKSTFNVFCFLFVLILIFTVSSCIKQEVNIENLLQEFEASIDELIPVMEALLSGDISQQPKFERISKKLTPILEKLEDNQNKMTEEEVAEYIRITMKLVSIEENR
jgi:hypothetical protein